MELPKKQSLAEEDLYVVEILPDIISKHHYTYNGYIQLCFHKYYGYVYSLGRSDILILNDHPVEWFSLEGLQLHVESKPNDTLIWVKNVELIKLMKKECSSSGRYPNELTSKGYRKISYFKDDQVKITKYCGFDEE